VVYAFAQITNPQFPIPNPQSPIPILNDEIIIIYSNKLLK